MFILAENFNGFHYIAKKNLTMFTVYICEEILNLNIIKGNDDDNGGGRKNDGDIFVVYIDKGHGMTFRFSEKRI